MVIAWSDVVVADDFDADLEFVAAMFFGGRRDRDDNT
jgi:hypothetical protein